MIDSCPQICVAGEGEYVGEMGDSVYRFPINHRKWYWSGRAKDCLNKEAKPDNTVV